MGFVLQVYFITYCRTLFTSSLTFHQEDLILQLSVNILLKSIVLIRENVIESKALVMIIL